MNHNFKMQLVALLATISGTALGNCHAMQVDDQSTESSVTQPAEPAYDGAFGTVKIAQPFNENASKGDFPPIISPQDAGGLEAFERPMVLPPIVKPFASNQDGGQQVPPITKASALGQEVNQSPASSQGFLSGSLAPLVPIVTANQTRDIPSMEIPIVRAPAPVIQADASIADSSTNGQIDPPNVHQAVQWSPQHVSSKSVSSGGVPLYPQAAPTGYTAPQESASPVFPRSPGAPSVNVPSIVKPFANEPAIVQGRSSAVQPPMIRPGSQIVTPMNTLMASPPTRANTRPMSMPPISAQQTSSPMQMSSQQMPMSSAPMATMDSVLMEPVTSYDGQAYFDSPPMEAPVIGSMGSACGGCGGGGCTECGRGGTSMGDVAGCQSCGPGGCFDGAQVANQFVSSGSVSGARRYLILEAMYLDRYDGTIALSNFGGLANFDNNLFGAKVTFGRREDCANGDEFVYFGSDKLSESSSVTDVLGRISAGFPNTGLFATETTAFRNAVQQTQSKETTFQSIEYNKVNWGWDVVRTFVGLRYIYVQDDYQITSQNLAAETGNFQLQAQNNMFGPQTGYELFYDVGYRLSWSTYGKFGLFANPNVVKTKLFNAGAQFLDLKDDNTALSGAIEMGLTGHYKVSERARFRFGYTALWLGEIATVSDNIPLAISPTTGSDTSDSGEMFFNGLSVGFEVFR